MGLEHIPQAAADEQETAAPPAEHGEQAARFAAMEEGVLGRMAASPAGRYVRLCMLATTLAGTAGAWPEEAHATDSQHGTTTETAGVVNSEQQLDAWADKVVRIMSGLQASTRGTLGARMMQGPLHDYVTLIEEVSRLRGAPQTHEQAVETADAYLRAALGRWDAHAQADGRRAADTYSGLVILKRHLGMDAHGATERGGAAGLPTHDTPPPSPHERAPDGPMLSSPPVDTSAY